ncbi:MAG TPA: hypothetical protein VE987_15895 [Polyangiaceae bacterium]|nr:hypothetical protein [Polyangiaceae bacterium]
MVKAIPPARRIQLLLNTLRGERYVRRPLLSELLEELTLSQAHPDAVRAGRALLERLEAGIDEIEYERRIQGMIELTRPVFPGSPYTDAAE